MTMTTPYAKTLTDWEMTIYRKGYRDGETEASEGNDADEEQNEATLTDAYWQGYADGYSAGWEEARAKMGTSPVATATEPPRQLGLL